MISLDIKTYSPSLGYVSLPPFAFAEKHSAKTFQAN